MSEGIGREEDIRAFTEHNRRVRESIPEERLPVFNVGEGWDPLCRFLGVERPEEPFPRVNDRENFGRMIAGNIVVGLLRYAGPKILVAAAGFPDPRTSAELLLAPIFYRWFMGLPQFGDAELYEHARRIRALRPEAEARPASRTHPAPRKDGRAPS